MEKYLDLLQHVLDSGKESDDRTGTGTLSCFGYQMRHDLGEKFPLLTTKKVWFKGVAHELLWFLRGDTNIKYLEDHGVDIWTDWPFQKYLEAKGLDDKIERYSDEWKSKKSEFSERIRKSEEFAEKWGELGPVYGKQWRAWEDKDGNPVDQIQQAIDMIENRPYSRRIIVNGWNIGEIKGLVDDSTGAPPPCHTMFQFYVRDGKLSCQLYQRSADVFLGVPFNIASYSLLTEMMAQVTGYEPGEFVHTFGDVHLYKNHIEQAEEQLSREPRELPELHLNPEIDDIDDFTYDDFELKNYNPHPAIKAPISV